MSDLSAVMHRRVAVGDGIELHVAEAGEGPPVILAHGFPELWFSWRHQLPALADAGYRAIAPDMRGYGDSSIPEAVEQYDILKLAGDLIALLDDLGEERAVFAGHDWGANVVWNLALAEPERVSAVVGMSVPIGRHGRRPPIATMRERLGDDFYMVWFQEPGEADEALARDVRKTLTATRAWSAKGDDREPRTPPWMTEEDLAFYVETFERTGFTGGLSYYRNIDRNWEITRDLADRRIEQPALFVAGSRDPVLRFMPLDGMKERVPGLRDTVIVDGAGHWIQQQSPDEVNAALLDFLRSLEA